MKSYLIYLVLFLCLLIFVLSAYRQLTRQRRNFAKHRRLAAENGWPLFVIFSGPERRICLHRSFYFLEKILIFVGLGVLLYVLMTHNYPRTSRNGRAIGGIFIFLFVYPFQLIWAWITTLNFYRHGKPVEATVVKIQVIKRSFKTGFDSRSNAVVPMVSYFIDGVAHECRVDYPLFYPPKNRPVEGSKVLILVKSNSPRWAMLYHDEIIGIQGWQRKYVK